MRRRVVITESLRIHFSVHRLYYVLFAVAAVVGVAYGIIYATNLTRVVAVTDIKSNTLKAIVAGNIKGGTVILENVLTFAGFTLLALALCVNIYFSSGAYLLMIYRGYLIGFNGFILVKVFGMGGAVNLIILYIPQQLFILALLVAAFAVCGRRAVANVRAGFLCFRGVEYNDTFSRLTTIGVLMLLLTLLQAIFIPLLSRSFLFIM